MQSCSWPEILARIEMGMWGAVREEGNEHAFEQARLARDSLD